MAQKVLVAGASRGIGLELAVQYAAESWQVVAACRNPEAARQWLPAGVDLQKLDVSVAASIAALAWHMDDAPLDLLIVNAGVYGPESARFTPPGTEEFDQVMHTNVLGAARLIQAFAPAVALARGKIAVLSSKMGSIEETTGSGSLAYRCSKAALNMVLKAAANEYGPQGATLIALHPGWVQTDMGGPDAQLGVTAAVEQMRGVLAGLSASDNGRFYDYSGRHLPW